jgi:hypothetical protein
MRLLFYITLVLVKNFFSFNLYKKDNSLYKIRFLLVNFILLVSFFYVNSFWDNNEIEEVIPIILCMDFFLILFVSVFKLYNSILEKYIIKRFEGLVNPFSFIINTKIKLKTFYLIVSFLELCFLFLILRT